MEKNWATAANFKNNMVLFCIKNSTDGGALYFKIQLVQGVDFSRQKRLTLRA